MYTDFGLISKQIEKYGEEVEIKVFDKKSYSEYGDLIDNDTSCEKAKAIFNTYGQTMDYNQEGMFREVSYSFFFNSGQEGLEIGNIIVRTSNSKKKENWKITKVIKHAIMGKSIVSECVVSNS